MAEKNASTGGKHSSGKGAPSRGVPIPVMVVSCCATLAIGVVAGHFLLGGGSGSISLNGVTSLSAGQLDNVVATYDYEGVTHNVTAREVLEEVQGSSDIAANEDGTYDVPSASDVLVYAQNQIILADADARGITVTDEEVDAYTEQSYGTADYATIASNFGLTEDAVRELTKKSAIVAKLTESVTTTTLPEQPVMPDEPADGDEDTATADYAAYVIDLLGDEWDSEANTWARTDGEFYPTLSSYDITNDSATYGAASAAYSVAQEKYSTAYEQISNEWNAYMSALLSRATIQIGTLSE